MHDTGPLVPPAEGGIVAKLIGAVHDAKKYNDAYLSNVIQTEKDRAADTPSDTPKKKRTKQNDDSSFGIRLS